MNDKILQLGNIIGCILQPLYLCLFIILTKRIKNKRAIFVILSIIDYLIVQNTLKFNGGIYADLIYTILFYTNIKFLYKEKGRITDVTTYIISFLIMGIFNIIFILLLKARIITILISNTILIIITLLLRNKLNTIEKFYNKFWNRHNFKFMKSVTIRGFTATITILTFVILHVWLIHGLL